MPNLHYLILAYMARHNGRLTAKEINEIPREIHPRNLTQMLDLGLVALDGDHYVITEAGRNHVEGKRWIL